jgi:hypothetical protein
VRGNDTIFDTYKYVAGRQNEYATWLKVQGQKLAENDSKAPNRAKPIVEKRAPECAA